MANELRAELGVEPLPSHRDLDDADLEVRVAETVLEKLPFELHDVSTVLATCESKMVAQSLSSGAVVLGLSLPGLSGNLGTKTLDAEGSQMPRLGRELASAAKLAGVKGIFHSDELPAYGITEAETAA